MEETWRDSDKLEMLDMSTSAMSGKSDSSLSNDSLRVLWEWYFLIVIFIINRKAIIPICHMGNDEFYGI